VQGAVSLATVNAGTHTRYPDGRMSSVTAPHHQTVTSGRASRGGSCINISACNIKANQSRVSGPHDGMKTHRARAQFCTQWRRVGLRGPCGQSSADLVSNTPGFGLVCRQSKRLTSSVIIYLRSKADTGPLTASQLSEGTS
jgi:hypothetical protein